MYVDLPALYIKGFVRIWMLFIKTVRILERFSLGGKVWEEEDIYLVREAEAPVIVRGKCDYMFFLIKTW